MSETEPVVVAERSASVAFIAAVAVAAVVAVVVGIGGLVWCYGLQNHIAATDQKLAAANKTNADLACAENILSDHISEAVQYRSLDRQLWT